MPLVIDTVRIVIERRNNPKGIIIHSDQRSGYTSYVFQDFVKRERLTRSMSRKGKYLDDTVIESLHLNLNSEELQYINLNLLSVHEVRKRVEYYLTCYNEERIQEKLGYFTLLKYSMTSA